VLQFENIEKFLKAVTNNFPQMKSTLFTANDLFEEQNLTQVWTCLAELAKLVHALDSDLPELKQSSFRYF